MQTPSSDFVNQHRIILHFVKEELIMTKFIILFKRLELALELPIDYAKMFKRSN